MTHQPSKSNEELVEELKKHCWVDKNDDHQMPLDEVVALIQAKDAEREKAVEGNPIQFIADLYELKRTMIRPPLSYREYVEPNITYSVIEMLIAMFCDKYKIKHEELAEELRKRQMSTPHTTKDTKQ